MEVGTRSESADLNEQALEEMLKTIQSEMRAKDREMAIRSTIWNTYVCQDLLMKGHHDSGGLSQIFKHKLAYRALIARGRVQGSAVGWLPGLDPESQAAAVARPAALLAGLRGRLLEGKTQNLLARLPSSVE